MNYKLAALNYYYPYKAEKGILNPYDIYMDKPIDKSKEEHEKFMMGVLGKYYNKKLTEEEADELLCEIIKKHPYIDGAMKLKIEVYIYDNKNPRIYQSLTINNEKYMEQLESDDNVNVKWAK